MVSGNERRGQRSFKAKDTLGNEQASSETMATDMGYRVLGPAEDILSEISVRIIPYPSILCPGTTFLLSYL